MPEHRPVIHEEIFNLLYYSNGSFTFRDIHDLPIYLRKFYLKRLIQEKETEKKLVEEQSKKSKKSISRPNIRKG
jgi:hypothetical protein